MFDVSPADYNLRVRTLKADVFATADCKFELANLVSPAPAGSAITGAGSVANDPNTECDENALLLKKPSMLAGGGAH